MYDIFYDDYTKSDYTDPILYPDVKYINLFGFAEQSQETHEEYCDLTDIIDMYNMFLKRNIEYINIIIIIIRKFAEHTKLTNTNDVRVNEWLTEIRIDPKNIPTDTIKFNPLIVDVSHVLICNDTIEILEMIFTDMQRWDNLIRSIKLVNIINKSPIDTFENIFGK